jgi:hypothetical protein
MPQYNGVWTLEAAAQAQSNQQWVTDPNFRNTTLLLQADGVGNGFQNNTFLDSSSNGFPITRNGNVTQGSFTPFSEAPGSWSTFFNGSNQKIAGVAGANFAYGTGAFTVEAFVYTTGSASGQIIFSQTVSGTNYFLLQLTTTNKLEFIYAPSGGGTQVTSTINVPLNTWTHVAAVRQGTGTNQFALYINGVNVVTSTVAQDFTSTSLAPTIGDYTHATSLPFAGYISNLRVIKGQALFTGSFNPATAPLTSTSVGATGSGAAASITGTVSLLAMQSNWFVDNGATGMTLTPTGTPSVQAFSPFAQQYQWTAPVIGGSGYFNGSSYLNNSLLSTSLSLGTLDWCMEGWGYWTSFDFGQYGSPIISFGGGNSQLMIRANKTSASSTSVNYYSVSNGTFVPPAGYSAGVSAGTIYLNVWNHIALTRSGSTFRLFVNGALVNTQTDSTAYSTAFTNVNIGSDSGPSNGYMAGYITGVRFVTGNAVYTSAFTPPTTPPTAISGTYILTNFTNAGIYDGTMNNNPTIVSTTQVSTSLVKYGSGSIAFNGTSTSLTFPDTTKYNLFNLGTGDFTIEFWFYVLNTTNNFVYTRTVSGTNALAVTVGANSTDRLAFVATTSGAGTPILSAGVPLAGVWQHAAAVRQNGYVTVYLNGVGGTPTLNTTNLDLTYVPTIGAYTHSFASAFNGYLDDFRITKGIARYTANFIPPQVALPRQ